MIKPLTNETWSDFVALMKSDSQCSECWCLNHRELSGCPTGLAAQEKMRSLVSENKVHGLLFYKDQISTAWIAIDPMASLVGHDLQKTGKDDEWSIHCLYVKEGSRGQGISKDLIREAIGYAKEKGAKLISAFPIPAQNRDLFPPDEAEFSGRFSTFKNLGFRSDGEPSEFYQRMELR